MEIFDGGHIYVDENDGDCSNPKFDISNPMSYYGGTKDGNKAAFITNDKPGKWSGELFVVQGDTDSIEVSDLNVSQKQFQVLQKVTNCVAAPSMSPSILPTDLPSYSSIPSKFPTRDPSPSPSSIPSFKPSALPSNIHSSLPSLYPSALHPNACPSDGFLGRTFKSVVYDQCWIFETYPGGKMTIDPSDSTCSKVTPDSTAHVLSQYKQSISNKFVFERIPGATGSSWEGYIQIVEDAESTQETLKLTKFGWTTNKFAFMLKVSDCASSEPSVKPSLKPSTSPSSQPSSVWSSSPSSEPSFKPSGKPSAVPSSKPSSVPSSSPSSEPISKPSSKPSLAPSPKPSSVPSSAPSSEPSFKPSSSPKLTSLQAFGYNTCIRRVDELFCWLQNNHHQLLGGTTPTNRDPKRFPHQDVKQILHASPMSCMVMKENDELRCWGVNSYGQLGQGDTLYRASPTTVELAEDVDGARELALGYRFACVIDVQSNVQCWGRNHYYQIGPNLSPKIPNSVPRKVELSGGVGAEKISLGYRTSCVIDVNKRVQCWGDNTYGELGTGSTDSKSDTPTLVTLDRSEGATDISVGAAHVCIIDMENRVQCWGQNIYGKLGIDNENNQPENQRSPVIVELDENVLAKKIAVGWQHTCVIDEKDRVQCWGRNNAGQIGVGTFDGSIMTPTKLVSKISIKSKSKLQPPEHLRG
jgi:alpha-tubulin suppressor-like RCC1 family protein